MIMSKQYQNPLIERYSSKEMLYVFSPQNKFSTWRALWYALAESEHELGLSIDQEQLDEMKHHIDHIDFVRAAEIEKEVRHDVMAHVLTYGEQCPKARPIIHLGATSAFVGDNTDLILSKKALQILQEKLAILIDKLAFFASKYQSMPTLGYTHFQPAQLTTVGKRATLWLYDLVMDYEDITLFIDTMKLRGVKGTTGTQASYLNLFAGDDDKVKDLDVLVAKKMGFSATMPVTGQTYSRKIDAKILSLLSGVAVSLHKCTNDIRILQSLKELEEPFEDKQIGSSAMAYKRNPMRSERVSSLSKYVISLTSSPQLVGATQWFERTLDDSANKRLVIPESFLAIDAALDIMNNIATNLVVYPQMIEKHIRAELPFMVTENIIMESVKKGGDRQELHEMIRVHSMEAAKQVKQLGLENDLLKRIVNDPHFGMNEEQVEEILTPGKYIGRSAKQVEEFINEYIQPIRQRHHEILGKEVELRV